MQTNELKPCPFCGKIPVLKTTDEGIVSISHDWYTQWHGVNPDHPVISQNTAPLECTVETITAGWNYRPIEDALTREVARLTAELELARAALKAGEE